MKPAAGCRNRPFRNWRKKDIRSGAMVFPTIPWTKNPVWFSSVKFLITKDIPSWKRMCYCILKNDHTCRFMGFGLTRQELKRVEVIKKKYGGMLLDK